MAKAWLFSIRIWKGKTPATVGTSARQRPLFSSGVLLQEKKSDTLASRNNNLFIDDFLGFTKK
jgi:hypothetical protein